MSIINRIFRTGFLFATLSIIVLSSGCDEDNPTDNSQDWTSNKTVFDVTWGLNTVKFDVSDMAQLASIDSSEQIYYFHNNSAKAASLSAGKIFVINDYMIRKVKEKKNIGGQYVITTEPCTFEEAASNADISWDVGIDLTPQNVISSLKHNGATIQKITADSLGFQMTIKNFEINGFVKFLNQKTHVQLTFEKIVGGIKPAKMIVDGYFSRFRSKGLVKINDHKLQEYNAEGNQINGEFTVKVIAAGSGNDIGIEIPFPLVAGPLGIPFFTWEIKFLGVMNASVPQGGSTLLEEKFIYDCDMGFQYVKATKEATINSNVKKTEIELKGENQHTGAASPIQVAWGIAVPRFEIGFMGTTIAWFHSAYLLDGYYRPFPACQKIDAHLYYAAGINVGLLTVSLYSKSWNIKDFKKQILKSGDCPD